MHKISKRPSCRDLLETYRKNKLITCIKSVINYLAGTYLKGPRITERNQTKKTLLTHKIQSATYG